jgi:hypothetical protein
MKRSKAAYSGDTCTPMSALALLTIVKSWNQPGCPSTDEWTKKLWHIYTMEFYSAVKKKFCVQENGQNWRSSC